MSNLVITDAGIKASANAKAGGFLIDVENFRVGAGTTTPTRSDTDLADAELYAGVIDLIEVMDDGIAMFTLELPIGSPVSGSYTANEVALYLSDGTLFARGVFDYPVAKAAGINLRVYAFLRGSAECDLTTINVTVGTHTSIPSVASVRTLPAPNTGAYNVYSVLDLKVNDAGPSASLAVRYGGGSTRWSFVGWNHLFDAAPTAVVAPTPEPASDLQKISIKPSYIDGNWDNDKRFIGQIVSGAGAGQSRKLVYKADARQFEVLERAFPSLDTTSQLAWWALDGVADSGGDLATCTYPPDLEGIPPDWVLTRGPNNGCPTWGPPAQGPGASGISQEPCDLKAVVVYFTGNGRTRTYDVGQTAASGLVSVSLDGIEQHTDAYDVQNTQIVFSEYVPPGVNIEVTLYDKAPSKGSRWKLHTEAFQTDGDTRRFPLSVSATEQPFADPNPQNYIRAYLSGVKQFKTAFMYEPHQDGTAYVVFNEAPPAGLDLLISWASVTAQPGYAVDIVTNCFIGTGNSETYYLSVYPESRDHLFVSISGVALHNEPKNYTLSGNRLTIPSAITKGLPIQVTVFVNTLSEGSLNTKFAGVVTGAISSHSYIKLLRYGAPDVNIPFQKVSIEAMDGINVVGEYPNFHIQNTFAPKPRSQRRTPTRYSTLHTVNDVEEIIYAYKFPYDDDMTVSVTADFACRLGPGFVSADGYEFVEYVLGFKTLASNEPPYGRRIKGTGVAGFSYLSNGQYAYANASVTQTYDLLIDNTKVRNVTFIAKMRIRNGSVSRYKSMLDVNFSLLALPKYGD